MINHGSGVANFLYYIANAAEVQAIGVEADGKRRIGLRSSTVMDFAGGDEELHAGVVELEVPGFAELQGYPAHHAKVSASRATTNVDARGNRKPKYATAKRTLPPDSMR